MLRLGLFGCLVIVVTFAQAGLWSLGDSESDWARQRAKAAREFGKVGAWVGLVVTLPLLVGGAVGSLTTPLAGQILAGLLGVVGLGVAVKFRSRWRPLALSSEFWSAEAKIGDLDRRHTIQVIALTLAFSVVVLGLCLVAT